MNMNINKINKIFAIVIIISAIAVFITSCDYSNLQPDRLTNTEVSPDGTWLYEGLKIKSQTDIYGYDYLTEGGQKVFDLMYGEYFSGEIISGEKGTQNFKLPEPIFYEEYKRVLMLYNAATLRYNRPRFRYDTNDKPQWTHSDTVETVYAGGVSSGIEEIDKQFLKAQEKAAEIISEMPTNLSEAEKCRYIAEYLAENVTYFTEERPSEFFMTDIGYITRETSQGNINTAVPLPDFIAPYGAMINGEANCMGYSRAFAALAYEAEINCIVVLGEIINRGYHAWNMVKIDDNWYHIDATWIDNTIFDERYFMVNDEQITKTHVPLWYGYCDFVPLPAAE